METAARSLRMIDTVSRIWQQVLRRPTIGVEDNFFEIGGDPALAGELFNEIARVCDRELSPAIICQAPTIAALAVLLEQPTWPRLSPLVLLKAGTETPPIFFAHGIGGNMMEFFQLARQVQSPRPMYGMQARGMDGRDEPMETIEAMAEYYLDHIREIQTHGPYFLIGFSLGGLLMLEVAQRLSEHGEKVGLLALLDSYPHRRYLSPGQRMRLMARLAKRRASNVMQLLTREKLSDIFHRRRAFRGHPDEARSRNSTNLSFAEAAELVRVKTELAWTRYRPRPYHGTVKFVRASVLSYFPEDPVAVWAHLVARLEVETVPGDHGAMITTHSASLAAVLTRYLHEAFADPRF